MLFFVLILRHHSADVDFVAASCTLKKEKVETTTLSGSLAYFYTQRIFPKLLLKSVGVNVKGRAITPINFAESSAIVLTSSTS